MQQYSRKSRKQFRREAQPLAANTAVAGKNVAAFRRFVPAAYPPAVELRGKARRSGGWYDPSDYYVWPGKFRRSAPGKYPPAADLRGSARRRAGHPPAWLAYETEISGVYRVADDSMARYELFIGAGDMPDLSGTPAATSATLPIDLPVAVPASETEYYVVVLRRNRYGLASLNQYARKIIIDAAGLQVVPLPSSPQNVSLREHRGYYVQVAAEYLHRADGDSRADYWAIYATHTGVDPDPGTDTPTLVKMHAYAPKTMIQHNVGPFAPSAAVRVLVRARRSSDGAEDIGADVSSLALSSAISQPSSGAAFGGNVVRL